MIKAINSKYSHISRQISQVLEDEHFSREGQLMHSGRNTVKRFSVGGADVVVKRYGRITLFNRLMYATLRKSKAQRAYENACRLRLLGINTPEEIAYAERRRGLTMTSCSVITLFSDWHPMTFLADYRFGDTDTEILLDALTVWIISLHDKGVEHQDLNIGNILYRKEHDGRYSFQVIDINRMRFRKSMTLNKRLKNLCRLSLNTDLTNYILRRYAELNHQDHDHVVIQGFLYKGLFELRQTAKREIRKFRRPRHSDSATA